MTINTVETKGGAHRLRRWVSLGLLATLGAGTVSRAAAPPVSPWVAIFKGVEQAGGTNLPGVGPFAELQVMTVVRVDLTDPDVQLMPTPRIDNYTDNYHETAGYAVSNYLTLHKLQVAINANNFHDPGTLNSPSYTATPGTPFVVGGLLVSRGQVVSTQKDSVDSASFLFDATNRPTFVPTNWPAHASTGVSNAVSGLYPVVVGGVNTGYKYLNSSGSVHDLQPRTAIGTSQDRRYLFLMTVDGRQPGYSDGAYDWETGAWLLAVGAWDGANMDGGGSSTLVMADAAGRPVELNHPSAVADPGTHRERTVGGHLGVFAKPVPAFINNIVVEADDTVATVTWDTIEPATSQVRYGVDDSLGQSTPVDSGLATNHTNVVTGLKPGTGYYFQAVSQAGGTEFASSNLFFTTVSYATTNLAFDLTNVWSYATVNLDRAQWTAPGYDASGWPGSGPGLLWADSRGPNADLSGLSTPLPLNPSTGFPFVTYYFRTHFAVAAAVKASTLGFTAYVDDGAVFYLNGAEISRLRMDPAPAVIQNDTLAVDYPCSGNATCADSFTATADLVAGDNVLAVEVHNYNAGSPDITFGVALTYTQPRAVNPTLTIEMTAGSVTLRWTGAGYVVQAADAAAGPWQDIPGAVASPYAAETLAAARFYRLRR